MRASAPAGGELDTPLAVLWTPRLAIDTGTAAAGARDRYPVAHHRRIALQALARASALGNRVMGRLTAGDLRDNTITLGRLAPSLATSVRSIEIRPVAPSRTVPVTPSPASSHAHHCRNGDQSPLGGARSAPRECDV